MDNGGYTLSDIATVTGNGRNDGMFGGDGAWWIIVLFLFAFLGWGGNYGGFGGGAGAGASDNYVLASDFATLQRLIGDGNNMIERKLDGVYAGICDSTFALNNAVNNGFASAQNTLTQGFAGLNTALVQQGYEGRIATQGVGTALQNCCCDLRQQISDTNYNLASQANNVTNAVNSGFCQTNYNNATNTRDVIDNANANTRAILDAINANKVEALKDRIAEQNQMINSLQLTASQTAQNSYLIDKLGYHCPVSAYVVQPPQNVSFQTGCNGVATFGNNSCCGCNG